MMGKVQSRPGKLFYDGFRLDERVRSNHPLRVIRQMVDFNFAYQAVKECYGYNGNVSVPPPVILKLMFLLFYYDVASERELMETLAERLDWLWFLGYDLDDPLPDHSVLSKARKRWGIRVFWSLFVQVVRRCEALGLVDGSQVHCDSSLVDANAANDSIRAVARYKVLCGALEQRLSDPGQEAAGQNETAQNQPVPMAPSQAESAPVPSGDESAPEPKPGAERRYISTTDSDAAVVKGRGGARARYKTHRMVDNRYGAITATEVTSGDVNEAHRLKSLMDQHEVNTGKRILTVTADSKYGTIDNYLHCHDRHVVAHLPDLKRATATSGKKRGIFSDAKFRYCPEEDA